MAFSSSSSAAGQGDRCKDPSSPASLNPTLTANGVTPIAGLVPRQTLPHHHSSHRAGASFRLGRGYTRMPAVVPQKLLDSIFECRLGVNSRWSGEWLIDRIDPDMLLNCNVHAYVKYKAENLLHWAKKTW
uniref:Uncharacterized protein n=1 Tax=Aegilops tauschii TaxID=37682 RepID=R7VZ97_AEGTA